MNPESKKTHMLLDFALGVALPSFVLMKLSGPEYLGAVWSFAVALAIPFAYGIYGAISERKLNWIAALGLLNIAGTGGLRFLEIGKLGFALKEAFTPAVIGIAVLYSLRSDTPLVKKMLYNEKILNLVLIEEKLKEFCQDAGLENLLVRTTFILASSFFVSSALNFGLAWYLLQSPVNSAEFNQELGKMAALSWPVIVLPSMAILIFGLLYLGRGIKKLTGLSWDEFLNNAPKESMPG